MDNLQLLEVKIDELLEILFDYEKKSEKTVMKILRELERLSKEIDDSDVSSIVIDLIQKAKTYIIEDTIENYSSYIKCMGNVKANISSNNIDVYSENE